MPPPPAGVQPPPMWGIADHIQSMFQAAGAMPSLAVETVEFGFSSVEETVRTYADQFGPFVIAHLFSDRMGAGMSSSVRSLTSSAGSTQPTMKRRGSSRVTS